MLVCLCISTDVQFASFFSSGFITAIAVNPPERRLAKRTSLQWSEKEIILGIAWVCRDVGDGWAFWAITHPDLLTLYQPEHTDRF